MSFNLSDYNEDCLKLPSEETDQYWIRAFNQLGPQPESLEFAGKWLLYVPVESVDDSWETIHAATENYQLGFAAKVATMKQNRHAQSQNVKVICVYTKDFRNIVDVREILTSLRSLGFKGRINYKEDNATYAGIYENSNLPASLYTSPSGSIIKVLRKGYGKDGRMTIDVGEVGSHV